MADAVADLQTSLASAATAAEVAAVSASLAAVQADLDDLLAANNIYSTAVSITDDATLDFADALGTKLSIVNNSITITQTKEMDAVQLQKVMDRIQTATGSVTFTSTDDATTVPTFNNLTSVTGGFTLNQKADVSLPKLKTASTLTITDNNKVTSVSAPVLETYSLLGTTSHAKVANYSMPMLKRFSESQNSGAFTLTVDSGTVDFSSVVTLSTAATPLERSHAITINGATIVKAPKIVSGKLTMNSVAEPNFPVWEGTTASAFAKAKKVVLPAIKGDVQIDLDTFAPKATYFHMIGAEFNPPNDSSVDSDFPTFTAGTNNSVIETLILDGAIKSVIVSGASDLTSYTHTGKTHDVDFINNDSMTSVTFGHTTTLNTGAKGVAVTYGTLEVSGNLEITSVTATELDDISELNISNNAELSTLSFPKLNSLGKDSDGTALTAVTVDIYSNQLAVQNVQLASPTNYTPSVTGKVTTDSGITGLKAYLDAAIATAFDVITVKFDTVDKITDHLGEEFTADTAVTSKTTGITASTNDATIDAAATSDAWVFIQTDKGTAAGADDATLKQTVSAVFPINVEGDNFTDVATDGTDALVVVAGGLTKTFDGGTNTGEYPTVTAIAEAINATDFGSGVTVTANRDAYGVAYNKISYSTPAGAVSTVAGAAAGSNSVTVYLGTASGTFATGTSALTSDGLAQLVATALNNKETGGKKYSVSAATKDAVIKVSRLMTGTTNVDYGRNTTFPSISILDTNTAGYYKWSANASNTVGLTSDYNLSVTKNVVNGLRITFTNNSFAVALTSANSTATITAGAAIAAKTDLVSGTNHHSDTSVSVPFSLANNGAGTGSSAVAALVVDATAWL